MTKLEELQHKKKQLDEQIRLAKDKLRRENIKIRNHRLIQLGAEVEKKLKNQYDFDIMDLVKKDFDYYVKYWGSLLEHLPRFERPEKSNIVFIRLTKDDPDFTEVYQKLKQAKARWSAELQLWELEASQVEELSLQERIVSYSDSKF